MQLHLTVPLEVEDASKRTLELMPVVLEGPRPSDIPDLFLRFLKPNGMRIPMSPIAISRVQRYMVANSTEAVSEDGVQAFTVAGNALVECLPEVCKVQ